MEVGIAQLFQRVVTPAFELRYYPEDLDGSRLQPMNLSFVRSTLSGRTVYMGVPIDSNGFVRARGIIIMRDDSMMLGSRALSYIISGGWSKGNATTTKATTRAAKQRLFVSFWQALLSHASNEHTTGVRDLRKTLEAFIRVAAPIIPGKLVESDVDDLCNLGCPQWLADALAANGYRPNINPLDVAARFVRGNHTHGDWTERADIEAATNCLTIGVTRYLRTHNVQLTASISR